MKNIRFVLSFALVTAFVLLCPVRAVDTPKTKVKPYILDTCAVCEMNLSDMGKPYTFVYKDREIKVCDKGEAEDFKKNPAKYLKKIEAAEAKSKKTFIGLDSVRTRL